MHRQPILSLLRAYKPVNASEALMTQATLTFIEQHPNCFDRSLLVGHVTGSAWIVSPNRQQTVLIHHRKLDRWFQPGGHADGDPDIAAVAVREAEEETGLTSLHLVSPAIFDVDVHPIPARGDVPEHLHYDIRFLLEANPEELFQITDEVKNIRWFPLEAVETVTDSESILRMVRKVQS